MKLLIACPSKGRVDKLELNTWGWLKYTKFPFKFFVEEQDFPDYKSLLGERNLVVLPESDKGLWYAKKQIQKYGIENGYDYLFKLDDDVQSWRDPSNRGLGKDAPKRTKEYRCEHLFEPIIKNSIELLNANNWLIGAISLMYGNDMKSFTGEKWIGINKRLQSCYIIKTELFVPDDYPNFQGSYEDFVTFFNIVKKQYFTVRYGLTGMDVQPVGKNKGGCQSFDRRQGAKQEMDYLLKYFPEIIWKPVQGKNWDFEPDFRKLKQIL